MLFEQCSLLLQGLVEYALDTKNVTLLASRVGGASDEAGSSIDYANDPEVAPDGKVYFTDSAHGIAPVRNAQGFWDTMAAYLLILFQVRLRLKDTRP